MRIQPAEYERMRAWLGCMVPKLFDLDLLTLDTDPVAVLDRTASKSAAKARTGLGMAIADVVEFTSVWSSTDVEKCNNELSEKGLPTLTEVQARFSKVTQRVVRRRHIKNDQEYYALRNAVETQGANTEALWPLLATYETRQ